MPLNDNLEEKGGGSIPEIPINEGSNCVGRSCVPVNDKRLSRKHLIVNATSGGSAEVLVVSLYLCLWCCVYMNLEIYNVCTASAIIDIGTLNSFAIVHFSLFLFHFSLFRLKINAMCCCRKVQTQLL